MLHTDQYMTRGVATTWYPGSGPIILSVISDRAGQSSRRLTASGLMDTVSLTGQDSIILPSRGGVQHR